MHVLRVTGTSTASGVETRWIAGILDARKFPDGRGTLQGLHYVAQNRPENDV